jgi:hypothetical protein
MCIRPWTWGDGPRLVWSRAVGASEAQGALRCEHDQSENARCRGNLTRNVASPAPCAGCRWVGPSARNVYSAMDLGRWPQAGMESRRWRYGRCLPDDRPRCGQCGHTLAVGDDARTGGNVPPGIPASIHEGKSRGPKARIHTSLGQRPRSRANTFTRANGPNHRSKDHGEGPGLRPLGRHPGN